MRITAEHSTKIESLVSKKTFTLQDIVSLLENLYTDNQIKYHINKFYPESKGNLVKEYSKGGTKLEYLLKELYPSDKIVKEFPLGDKLRVDFIVLAPYNLAFEYDGSQHAEYSSFFHGDKAGFRASQERDSRKEFLLKNRGINLIRIDSLNMDVASLEQTIQELGYGNGVIVDPSLLTSKEKTKARHQELSSRVKVQRQLAKEQIKKQLQEPTKAQKKQDTYKQSLKDKQKTYRDEQYQKQKLWQKENKKKKSK